MVPWRVRYSLEDLLGILEEGDDVAFYGGEPLLNMGFVKEVLGRVRAAHFILQTNGLLLKTLGRKLVHRFDTILVSIDGPRWLTDLNRGRGVYDRVLENVRWLREVGYRRDLVARMTVTEDSDIYRDVTHILELNLFDHVHWQLSFVWVERSRWRRLWSWIEDSYEPGLRRLMGEWISDLREGRICGIAPFQGILKRMIRGEDVFPPCGSGVDSFTVLTDGRIVSCPIAVQEGWALVGRLGNIGREDLLKYSVSIGEPCKSCGYLRICGGRCLYTHFERLWGREGMMAICRTSRYLIDLMRRRLPEIMEAADEGGVSIDSVLYPRYNNTVEIIP